jgi:hypothetical protein
MIRLNSTARQKKNSFMKFFLKFILIFTQGLLFSQSEKSHSVYLIGDCGEDTVSGKALLMLKEQLLKDPQSTVVFLGDNVYPKGLKIKDHRSELKILSQLDILKGYKGRAYFIPGNHDWNAQKRRGLKILKDQQIYVDNYLKDHSEIKNKNEECFLPVDGKPGPVSIMLEKNLRLIIIDTQWFLHSYKKGKTGSKRNTKKLFYYHLDSLLKYSKENDQQVIISAHHPIYSNGNHSRQKQPLRFINNCTPFQIVGLLGLNRLYSQDLSQPCYKKMSKNMLKSFDKYDNIIYTSGHEHNLQLFKEKGNRYIISGCGSKTEHLKKKKRFNSIFEDDSKTGFIKLEYFADKKIITTIYRVGEDPKILTDY